MAKAASVGLSLRPGTVFKTSGRQLITLYLGRHAARGELSDGALPGGCTVAAGVDVFGASPNALPFPPSHTRQHGEVWGYFAAAHMADSIQPAPGGCWVRYGKEKPYVFEFKTVLAYRSRFAFHVTRVDDDGTVTWAPTRWMMKEYRLNKSATILRQKKLECPDMNMDFVIRNVFTKPTVPVRPPAFSDVVLPGVGGRLASSKAQPTMVPVKASVLAVRKDSTKTKTKPKPKPKPKSVVPPPLPPYARSESGELLQQGGSSLPPRSARPPLPSKVIAKPVSQPPPPNVIATPVAPPQPTQVIAKPAAQPPPPKVIETPVAQPPQPKVIATPVVPPPLPQGIATPVFCPPPPAHSSQAEATSSRAQPDNPNANMELVVRRIPAQPLNLPTPPAAWRGILKVPSGLHIITQYLGPRAVHGQLSKCVTPGFVAEGVDVFAMSPSALPFPPSHRKQNGEVWGYFFAAKPTIGTRMAHGGCWMQYGGEKKYPLKSGEVVAFRRRFAFHLLRVDGVWKQTRWLMKEYRMNKVAPSVRKAKKGRADTDLVVLKVFTKPMAPLPPPPAPAGFSEVGKAGSNYHSVNEGASRSMPVAHPPPPWPPAWSP